MDSATTAATTSTVTRRTEASWNSSTADWYHDVVQPSGSQVPSHRLANEFTATAAIRRPMFTTKNAMSALSSPFQPPRSQRVVDRSLILFLRRRGHDRRDLGGRAPPRRRPAERYP